MIQRIEIRVRGQIDRHWSDWFGGLTITYVETGEMVLSGPVRDQAALRGILSRLADLNLDLISVSTIPDKK